MGLRWYAFCRRRRRRLGRMALVLVLAGLVQGAWLAGRKLYRLAGIYGESHCRNQIAALLLETAQAAIPAHAIFPEPDGEDTGRLLPDMTAVGECRSAAGQELARRLAQLSELRQDIPLGTLLGSPFLLGRGPTIPLRMIPVGDGTVQVRSSLQDAGVNQVLYTLWLEITVTVTVILPGEARELCCTQQVPLGQVLISGQVPWIYGAVG